MNDIGAKSESQNDPGPPDMIQPAGDEAAPRVTGWHRHLQQQLRNLLAGYTYKDQQQCAEALSGIFGTYLAGSPK